MKLIKNDKIRKSKLGNEAMIRADEAFLKAIEKQSSLKLDANKTTLDDSRLTDNESNKEKK